MLALGQTRIKRLATWRHVNTLNQIVSTLPRGIYKTHHKDFHPLTHSHPLLFLTQHLIKSTYPPILRKRIELMMQVTLSFYLLFVSS